MMSTANAELPAQDIGSGDLLGHIGYNSIDIISGNLPCAVSIEHWRDGLNRRLLVRKRSIELQDHVFAVGYAGK